MSMNQIPTFESLIGAAAPKEKDENKLIFAHTEVKKVLGWSKSPDEKLKIWQRTNVKEEDRDISIRNKISEIKQSVRERHTDLVGKNSQFINSASRKSIEDSEKILAMRSKNVNNGTKGDSVSDFIQNNKEVCLKNFIGQLLHVEKEKIETKKVEIQKALDGSSKKLDNDYKSFMSYIDNEKGIAKKNDEV